MAPTIFAAMRWVTLCPPVPTSSSVGAEMARKSEACAGQRSEAWKSSSTFATRLAIA